MALYMIVPVGPLDPTFQGHGLCTVQWLFLAPLLQLLVQLHLHLQLR